MSPAMERLAGIAADADTMTECPVDFGTPEWLALLEWLEFHGIDPGTIPAGSRVSRDECNRCIRYIAIVVDEQGRRQQAGLDDRPRFGQWKVRGMVEQGEGPPLPYPDVIARWLR